MNIKEEIKAILEDNEDSVNYDTSFAVCESRYENVSIDMVNKLIAILRLKRRDISRYQFTAVEEWDIIQCSYEIAIINQQIKELGGN